MLANNETGTVMPVAEIARRAREKAPSVVVHTDAAQAVGKIPVSVEDLGVDLLSVAGHKLYAPKGVGALYVRKGAPLMPFLLGGGHEDGMRPGTENVPGIVGLGEACELASGRLEEEADRLGVLTEELWSRLAEKVYGLELNGHPTERLPNTLNVRFPGVRGSELLARCPEIAASTGSACHEGGTETPSPVLIAMGLDSDAALGAVRLSVGRMTRPEEIKVAAESLVRAFMELASNR
jgi:cysteine desulfurase